MDQQERPGLPDYLQELMDRLGQTIPSSEIPSYKCEKCHDTGWLWEKAETGERFARKCSCRLAREAEEKIAASGLAGAVGMQTFDSFEAQTPAQETIRNSAQKYLASLLKDWDSPRKPWFYIGGCPGAGKTHICTAICGELLKANIGVKYMQWLNEARRLKAMVNDEDFEDQVSEYIGVQVLYIDDLLKQKWTEHPVFSDADIKIAFTILNARYILNRPTIISSEWDLMEHLRPADEATFSRVYERCRGHLVNITRRPANNFRMRGAGNDRGGI